MRESIAFVAARFATTIVSFCGPSRRRRRRGYTSGELAEPARLRSLTVRGVVWAKSAACEPMATRSGIQVLQSMNVMDQ